MHSYWKRHFAGAGMVINDVKKESRLFNFMVKGGRGRSTFGRRGRSTLRGRDQHTFPSQLPALLTKAVECTKFSKKSGGKMLLVTTLKYGSVVLK